MSYLFSLINQPILQIGNHSIAVSHSKKNPIEYQPFFESIEEETWVLEILQSVIKNEGQSIPVELTQQLTKLTLKKTNVLGRYFPHKELIHLYNISREYKEVVEIHERFHAIHHLVPDPVDGSIWNNFADIPPFYLELLAQIFTYKYIQHYNRDLLSNFETLNQQQGFLYKTWKIYKNLNLNEVENLYWEIRKNCRNHILSSFEQSLSGIVFHQNQKTNPGPSRLREIPTTKMRRFYQLLKYFSTETCYNMARDFNRENNYKDLAQIFNDSQQHFSRYSNTGEDFLPKKVKRKLLPVYTPAKKLNNTEDVCAFLCAAKPVKITNDSDYNFTFIEREIDPRRTTKTILDTGESGRHSSTGGLDFIGWNNKHNLPVLGEIKCGTDTNPFYALIQLLTYCSELSTSQQIARINKFDIFRTTLTDKNPKFLLYVILVDYNLNGELKKNLLPETISLSRKILASAGGIKEIAGVEYFTLSSLSPVLKRVIC